MFMDIEYGSWLKVAQDAGLLSLAAISLNCALKGAGLWQLAFAILALATLVASFSSIFHGVKWLKALSVLLQCFATCLVPLLFLFATLGTIPGIHVSQRKEKSFLFNLCMSLPVYAFLRHAQPVRKLCIIETLLMAAVALCALAAHFVPAAGLTAAEAGNRLDDANRLLLGALLWLSRLLPQLVILRWVRASAHTQFMVILVDYFSKACTCVVFVTPHLHPDVDVIGQLTGRVSWQ
eukprot:scpid64297/ scgid35700/ 